MANYAAHLKKTPAIQTIKDRNDQVQNSAGGFVYELDDMKKLDRFLIIGSDGGTYYTSEKDLTIKNAAVVDRLFKAGKGRQVIDRVVEISDGGRAPKNDPALLVMAMALSSGDEDTKRYAADQLPKVARIGTHLFTVVDYANSLRKWGRTLRRAVANWYNGQPANKLAFQVCKYQSRTKEGSPQTWSHKDVLRLAHVRPVTDAHNVVFNYVTKGWGDQHDRIAALPYSKDNPFNYIVGHEKVKKAANVDEALKLIEQYGLARESIPTNFLNDAKVWNAMLPDMPLGAMIRNLATMTRNGVVGPLNSNNTIVANKLADKEALKKARIHPIQILSAMKTYQSGRGLKGSNTWTPVQSIVDALDAAFYLSFDAIEPTNKRLMLSVDCSGSMGSAAIGSMPNLTAREIAAALALVTAKTESNYLINGFTNRSGGVWAGQGYGFPSSRTTKVEDGISDLGISPRMRMDSVVKKMTEFPWGGTDTSLPMIYAMEKGLKVDAFVVITDNETYQGSVKSDEALRQYRKKSGIHDAALVVVGCTATAFSIADPNDARMLDVVGLDTATPGIIADFIRGDL